VAKGMGIVAAVAALFVGVAAPSAGAQAPASSSCASTSVLLLGSYPAELSANLSREQLDAGQPTIVWGHDFYVGRLEGRRVILGIAGQNTDSTYAATALALAHFPCISAVVFEGTAGGAAAVNGVGDVTVASRWTSDYGKTFTNVDAQALAVARSIAPSATSQLANMADINDGPCACSGIMNTVSVVPSMRTPKVIVGGNGTTFGGENDPCTPAGQELLGCNPCPPGSATPTPVASSVTAGATTPLAAAMMASLAAKQGVLVHDPTALLAHASAPAPAASAASANASTTYVATDQQTTSAMDAAKKYGVPFIAFRGISDTDAVGGLWPFEWLVFQGLAADNAGVAARVWIAHWKPSASPQQRRKVTHTKPRHRTTKPRHHAAHAKPRHH
jgi:nucleoside phosphorylase